MYNKLFLKIFDVSQLIKMCHTSHLSVCVVSCTSSSLGCGRPQLKSVKRSRFFSGLGPAPQLEPMVRDLRSARATPMSQSSSYKMRLLEKPKCRVGLDLITSLSVGRCEGGTLCSGLLTVGLNSPPVTTRAKSVENEEFGWLLRRL